MQVKWSFFGFMWTAACGRVATKAFEGDVDSRQDVGSEAFKMSRLLVAPIPVQEPFGGAAPA